MKTVMGIVSKVKIGFTIAFKNAKATATIKAERELSTLTPGNNLATKNTAMAELIILSRKLMM